jgi:hypothetical protein
MTENSAMTLSWRTLMPRGVALAGMAGLAGCTSPGPVAYTGLASSPVLRPSAEKDAGHVPYRYSEDVNWRRYYKVILDPVEIYSGRDAQFPKLSDADRRQLADYMEDQFGTELAKDFELVARPDRATLHIHLTLTGAAPSKAVLGPLSRFDIAGGPYNAFQGIRGKEGTMTGSVIYAVEIYDSSTNKLLLAEIAKQYPGAMNVGAAMGALKAPMAGIRKGARELRERLSTGARGK